MIKVPRFAAFVCQGRRFISSARPLYSSQENTTSCTKSKISLKPDNSTTLRHLHFQGTVPYETGLEIQEQFVRANLDFKKIQAKVAKLVQRVEAGEYNQEDDEATTNDNDQNLNSHEQKPQISDYERNLLQKLVTDLKPGLILLTFEFLPVYTGGKREKLHTNTKELIEKYNYKGAYYYQSSRGGQVTYHGPGQMVGYAIIDLNNFTIGDEEGESAKKKFRSGLPARCFVNALEDSIINTVANGTNMSRGMSSISRTPWGIKAIKTENTGVWISETEKLASIGVHIRRAISSHGVAINVNTDLSYPNRFTMCGLENAKTTSLKELGVSTTVRDVGYAYAREFGKLFGFNQVEHYDVDANEFLNKNKEEKDQKVFKNGIREVL